MTLGDAGTDPLIALRRGCAEVAERARWVRIEEAALEEYAARLPGAGPPPPLEAQVHLERGSRETVAAFWLVLDAVNFGSGWFPTLRKRSGYSGYYTIAAGIRKRFDRYGSWTAAELTHMSVEEIAAWLGQDPEHELMGHFADSLRDLGAHITTDYGGSFAALADSAAGSAMALVKRLANWSSFADVSRHGGLVLPFLKRAQIAAADLHRAGVIQLHDLDRLTMFADNLVPHVLRLDGVLTYAPRLLERICRGELLTHGSAEEVEIRACAVHAVELIVAAQAGTCAAAVDQILWQRGQGEPYKAVPRHRTRCTAY